VITTITAAAVTASGGGGGVSRSPDSGNRRATVRWSVVHEVELATHRTAETLPWTRRCFVHVAPSARRPRSRSAAGWSRVEDVAGKRIWSTETCSQQQRSRGVLSDRISRDRSIERSTHEQVASWGGQGLTEGENQCYSS